MPEQNWPTLRDLVPDTQIHFNKIIWDANSFLKESHTQPPDRRKVYKKIVLRPNQIKRNVSNSKIQIEGLYN